jgi:flagellar basal-body rod protein FlgG
MRTYIDRNDVIANNLANASTAGFKKESVYAEPFDVLFARVTERVGDEESLVQPPLGTLRNSAITIFTPGPVRSTGNDLDLAINGDGFFKIGTPAGTRYTRDGAFRLSANGQVVNADGYALLGDGDSPVTINTSEGRDIVIAQDGTITVAGTQAGRITLADFEDRTQLRKVGGNLFEPISDEAVELTPTSPIEQRSLEMSNVNVIEELTALITNYRSYEMAQKMTRLQDDTVRQAIGMVGAVQ